MKIDQPNAVFGQRGREASAPAGRTVEPTRTIGHLVRLLGLVAFLLTVAGAVFWTLPGIEKMNLEAGRAERRVVEIVNQPITHLPRSGPVSVFAPGWFHPGATTPDFNNVDVRSTQELTYEGHVTSDLNPTEMFIGSELEFNAMTKYFYTDRTLPKKRLSNSEMIEINGLYRVMAAMSRRY
ncbi:hypothetical protein [Mesorhizobium salmacidum]|uniref:LPS export ABC transporter periplasmic protein LptC n=1 Tax=Mesorhizobium salmacidum TaxID=3015171 RepID=A0ABU8KQB5_9HYPH